MKDKSKAVESLYLDIGPIEVISRCPEDTQAVGRSLGSRAQPGDVILLTGELGAGKTCLTQGILWGLGNDEYARSPTFVLVSQYHGRLTLHHVDLYRVDTATELIDLGLDEYLEGGGVCVVEWAEKAPELFAADHLAVRLEPRGEDTRLLTLSTNHERYSEMIEAAKSVPESRRTG